jgi:hypothetical protein
MHSSSPEQNLPDFQVHKTLDSLDATGAVSDIPPKKIGCVWACLSWCFCPFSQDHEMDHGMDEHYDDHYDEHDDHDSDDMHFDPEDF